MFLLYPLWPGFPNFVRTLCMQPSYGTKINMRRFLNSTIRHCKNVWRIYWIKLDKKTAYLFGQNLEISANVDGLGTYLFLGEQRNSYHERRSYAIYIYHVRAIITRSWFEAAQDYNPRILGSEIEEFSCLVYKLSVILTSLH